MVAKRLSSSSSYMLSKATRSNLRGYKIKKFPGGVCPQTPPVGHAYACTVLTLSTLGLHGHLPGIKIAYACIGAAALTP